MTARPILVGESNPYGSDPRYALYPEPPQSAGARLARFVLGMSNMEYLRSLDRRNLVVGRFRTRAARESAGAIDAEAPEGAPIVMLGKLVQSSFGFVDMPHVWRAPHVAEGWRWRMLVGVPHPSGRCRAWNDPAVVADARREILSLIGGAP